MNLPRFRDLPLFGKLLVPFLALTLFLGVFGVFLVVRDLSARARVALDQDLARRTLDARSSLRDRELYLLESVNFAANLEGVARGIRGGEVRRLERLMQSVLALKTDLDLLAVTDARGSGLVEFRRGGARLDRATRRERLRSDLVAAALGNADGAKASGFVRAQDHTMLGIAAPICSGRGACDAVGVAVAAIRVDRLLATAGRTAVGFEVFDRRGRPLAAIGLRPASAEPPVVPEERQVRRTGSAGGEEVATLYSRLEIGGRDAGTLAVTIPTKPAFASVRGAQWRLALVLLAAMVGSVGLGAIMSRLILRQVRPLVDTNRSLGRGDLSARAPVLGDDELGELALGVNQMAEQLSASYENLETQVAQRTEEVRRLLEERTEFFASMSHELRTPLAVIKGQGRLLLDPTKRKDARKTAAAARTIVVTANQLVDLVNQILDMARAERGRLDVHFDHVRLDEVVKDLRPTVEGLAKGGGLRVSWNIPKDLPVVLADRTRVREILLNLVDNAVKYTPPGGRLTLSAGAPNGMVEVTVRDTGIGIAPEVGDRIFEPFYRAKGAATQGGQHASGLGLGLAKRLVEAQGGTIAYDSAPGEGTTFTFTLRRA